jgi:hypothetical protein
MFQFKKAIQKAVAVAVTSFVLLPTALRAQDHIVPLSELRRDMLSASQSRRANVTTVEKFLSSENAKTALKRVGMHSNQLVKAVATLSDDELARLSARAESAQQEFAAGALSNQELTYIVIALATAVIILVIVAA